MRSTKGSLKGFPGTHLGSDPSGGGATPQGAADSARGRDGTPAGSRGGHVGISWHSTRTSVVS